MSRDRPRFAKTRDAPTSGASVRSHHTEPSTSHFCSLYVHLHSAYLSFQILNTSTSRTRFPVQERKMPPTESTILSSYLLNPGRFPAVITLDEFTALFPRAHQSSPQIRALYRDLQHQRNALLDVVSENIRDEVAQARGLRRAVARARKESENLDLEDETRIERDASHGRPVMCCVRHAR